MQIKLIGITGKKASGKSSVATIFRRNNIPIVNIDNLYNNIFKPGTSVHREIIKYFGDDYIHDNGNIDLKKLSISICCENWIKETINDLIEEEIANFMEKLIQAFSFHRIDIGGIESGILSQTKIMEYISSIVLVESNIQNRMNRMISTMPKEVIGNIIKMEEGNEWDDYDFIIENNGTIQDLENAAINTIKDILLFYKQRRRS